MAGDEEALADSHRGPSRHGRRHGLHGEDLGRILALSDGVFAFAMTLLVLSLTVPAFDTTGLTAHEISGHLARLLQQDYLAFFGYVFAFVMIGIWWVIHNRTFQYIVRYDSVVVWINMALLLQIAVMPFVMSIFVDYSSPPTQTAVALFAGIQVTLGLTATLLWDYARRNQLVRPGIPEEVVRYFTLRGLLTAFVFAVSIGVTFVSVSGAEYVWIATFFVQRFADERH